MNQIPLFQKKPHIFGLSDHHIEKDNEYFLTSKATREFKTLKKKALDNGIELTILSSFRSFEDQKKIWNAKALGERPVLDDESKPRRKEDYTEKEWVFAILRWSAFPGLSRHHWGTDFDVYDQAALKTNPHYKVQLIPSEYETGGPFEKLGNFLHFYINNSSEPAPFFRPYRRDLGGVAVEPWHLSLKSEANEYLKCLNQHHFYEFLNSTFCEDIEFIDIIRSYHLEILERFAFNVSET